MSWMEEFRRLLQRLRRQHPEGRPPGDSSCQEAVERLFEWLDGELDPEESERVEEHMRTCALCFPRLAFETSFREAVARVERGEPFPEELEDRILSDLKAEGFTAS